eukprot:s1541_g26.t1
MVDSEMFILIISMICVSRRAVPGCKRRLPAKPGEAWQVYSERMAFAADLRAVPALWSCASRMIATANATICLKIGEVCPSCVVQAVLSPLGALHDVNSSRN